MREKPGKRGKSNYRIGIMWDERKISEEGQNRRDKINYRVELSGMREKIKWYEREIWEEGWEKYGKMDGLQIK